MFGFEILDVVIGLVFVYLLLSLFATALNEYIAAVFNLRGKELARGLSRLLDDVDHKGAVKSALEGLTTRKADAGTYTERLYAHPLINPLATRRGGIGFFRKSPRLPSYIPARTFAMALLDVLGVHDPAATLPSAAAPPPAPEGEPSAAGTGQPAAAMGVSRGELLKVLELLKRQSPADVSQARDALVKLLGTSGLSAAAQMRLLDALTASENELQKLQESVEVWFNDAMDRVSGAYKRTAQGWLFVLGILIAGCMNADTIDMWRRLQADDDLRAAMVRRAERTVAVMDSTRTDSPRPDSVRAAAAPVNPQPAAPPPATNGTQPGAGTQNVVLNSTSAGATDTIVPPASDSARLAAAKQARDNYERALARLDSMELKLGWTAAEALRVGAIKRDTSEDTITGKPRRPRVRAGGTVARTAADSVAPKKPGGVPPGYDFNPLFPVQSQAGFFKLLGLLMTGVAISLGAPFWFDLLNKVISIRVAGRSPEEKPRSPEAPAKRLAERAPK